MNRIEASNRRVNSAAVATAIRDRDEVEQYECDLAASIDGAASRTSELTSHRPARDKQRR